MKDKDILQDLLGSQRYMTETYNSFANESNDKDLRQEVLDILRDEHDNHYAVYAIMYQNGYYRPAKADPSSLQSLRSQFDYFPVQHPTNPQQDRRPRNQQQVEV